MSTPPHAKSHRAEGDDPRQASTTRIVVTIMVVAGLLLAALIAARFAQEEFGGRKRAGSSDPAASPDPNTAPDDAAENRLLAAKFPDTTLAATGIRGKILREGTGPKPVAGNRVRAHYTGRLLDGTQFDSSLPRGEPFEFKVLAGEVIRGWDLTVLDMRLGEKRLVVLPSRFAYGTRGSPPKIPPRAPLVFELELAAIE
jgi:FKBP-type peptidyl-prolyl cis-trans isomerase